MFYCGFFLPYFVEVSLRMFLQLFLFVNVIVFAQCFRLNQFQHRFGSRIFSTSDILQVTCSLPCGLLLTEDLGSGNIFCLLQHNIFGIPSHFEKSYEIEAFSSELCKEIIEKSERYASKNGGWSNKRHKYLTTTDLLINDIFDSDSELHGIIETNILNVMADKYNLQREGLRLAEGYVVKWDFQSLAGKRGGLEPHLDRTPFSFVVTLNPTEFTGGGTRFIKTNETIRPSIAGCAVLFSGKNLHEGVPITGGIRYILTGFCTYSRSTITENEDNHEAFLLDFDMVRDGSAAISPSKIVSLDSICSPNDIVDGDDSELGIHDGDILRGLWKYSSADPSSNQGDMIMTSDLSVAQVQTILKQVKQNLHGRNLCCLVERIRETDSGGNIPTRDLVWEAKYIKTQSQTILARGWFWYSDDFLSPSV